MPSPTKPSGMALHPAAAHAHASHTQGTPTPDTSTDDGESAEGAPQAMPSQDEAHAEQALLSGAAGHADEHPAHSQPAAACIMIVREETESALHTLHGDAVIPILPPPAHPGQAEAAKISAWQDASTPDSITQPGIQPAEPSVSDGVEIAQHAQPGQADESAATGIPEAQLVHEPQQAQRQDSAVEGEMYYDALPVQASVVPLAIAAASSAVPAQASPSMQIKPHQAEAVQESHPHPEAQRQGAPQKPDIINSPHASTAVQSVEQTIGAAKPGLMQRPIAAAGSMHSVGTERHVAVNLRCASCRDSLTLCRHQTRVFRF